MGNDVFRHNGFTNTVTTNNHITAAGSDWYWTVCSVMTVSAFGFMIHSYFKDRSQRLFHYLNAAACLIAAVSYFCMGSNLGWTAIEVEWVRSWAEVHGNMRQIFYVRYIDWFITTPLIVSQLLLVAGLPTPTILYTLVMTELVVINGLVGALVKSSYKWGMCSATRVLTVVHEANYGIQVSSPSALSPFSSLPSLLSGTVAPMLVSSEPISSASSTSSLPGSSFCGLCIPSSGVSLKAATLSLRTPRLSPTVSWIS
jgi:hypothetical protein